MMQVVDCGDRPSDANYNPRSRVASFEMPATEVDAIYPRGYQVYPNFAVEAPDLSRTTLQALTGQSPPERKSGRAGARGKLIKHS
jgi:hypothetical protein